MFGLAVDRSSDVSLLQQLTQQVRRLILAGELAPGVRLPPSRNLARELSIARNTIVQVYEQLMAEGYLESRTGAGTFVADLPQCCRAGGQDEPEPPKAPREERVHAIRFNAGNPDAAHFPAAQWARFLRDACLEAPVSRFEYGPAAGEEALRSALCRYLFRAKDIVSEQGQVFIIPGTARGVELLAGALAARGDVAAVEDPCIDTLPAVLEGCGLAVFPVPVDGHGFIPELLPRERPASLIYTVPSHQFPTGGVLPIGRRLKLLEYARSAGAYVLEDDYDSEFRYQGEPIQSLRHLDPERVVYLGTFSKIFTPALRLGYMIIPRHLQDRIAAGMERVNLRAPALEQAALARFIDEGLLERHVYRMKKLYEEKRRHLIDALREAFGGVVEVSGANAGLHVLATFRDMEFISEDFHEFRRAGVEVDWVEDYAILKGGHRNQLVLGYGGLSHEQITAGVQRLKRAVDAVRVSEEEEL